MSLYHEAADVLDTSKLDGGNLRSRVFGRKDRKSSPAQIYALALETCKWSLVLKEVVENAQLLQHEKKLTPLLSLLLVHDFLLSKSGIALPASHGLRASIERHKARLTSEFTRARVRRKCPTIDALREVVEADAIPDDAHPRWIRINAVRTTLEQELETTFKDFEIVQSPVQVVKGTAKSIHIDEHIPNLVAVSPRFDFTKSAAYKSGALILQDKASCFPAYLLNPTPAGGDVIDSCAAPGNKTTHIAAILRGHYDVAGDVKQTIHAFEKDARRARTLEKMVKLAGSDIFTRINQGQDFLKVNPADELYQNVGALLLDPSCSGSGIVGRDDMPELHLPVLPGANGSRNPKQKSKETSASKRKRDDAEEIAENVMVDDDGNTTVLSSEKDLNARLASLSSFQLTLLLHAFRFPAAKRITYSTCSVHVEENEGVVLSALQSDIAGKRGWRILERAHQPSGMQKWPVRGLEGACPGQSNVADACIRAYKDDGRGVMGFFVAAFVRDGDIDDADAYDNTGGIGEMSGGQSATATALVPSPHSRGKRPKTQPQSAYIDERDHNNVEVHEESDWSGFDD
ncbi:putative nol1 nop2 sun family protein [Phaeoacremonium minimum UCRPA7]|uniref:Putative nol1 nop2 sun family protein n=1 Tax=Phaeoacremonium minimum (strain UCR-PA7) TaxID=1286976 RepID=R8BFN4_PHAM7|nr:putative nol1 nop2 sun family protein [Phaeoacremonium minimum UCRPA7]EON98121.1 putative nol1 nop2 sun family protein [Phaeoacremonium minimum UCRPA7]